MVTHRRSPRATEERSHGQLREASVLIVATDSTQLNELMTMELWRHGRSRADPSLALAEAIEPLPRRLPIESPLAAGKDGLPASKVGTRRTANPRRYLLAGMGGTMAV